MSQTFSDLKRTPVIGEQVTIVVELDEKAIEKYRQGRPAALFEHRRPKVQGFIHSKLPSGAYVVELASNRIEHRTIFLLSEMMPAEAPVPV